MEKLSDLTKKLSDTVSLPTGMESWQVPISFNSQYFLKVKPQGSLTYDTLRNMSRFYDIARTCITIKQNQITQLDWDVTYVGPDEKDHEDDIKIRKDWIAQIGAKNTFSKFLKKVIEDMLVIDGVALYKRNTYGGGIANTIQIDPSTIKLRVDDNGLTPEPPEFAYEQWIRGSKKADLTTDEMYYHISNPRSDSPYGYSVMEGIMTTVESSLKVGMYNMAYFTDGTMPEGFYELPSEWGLNQIKAYQEYWDAMMSGDPHNMRKLRFMPAATSGKGFQAAKNFDFAGILPFLEWLMKLTCSAFGVMPQELGFTEKVNKSSSQEQTEIGKRNSMKALAFEIEEMINHIMKNDLVLDGKVIPADPNYTFTFMDLDPKDEFTDAQITDTRIKAGLTTINEWRGEHGLDDLDGGNDPFIITSQGVILVKDIPTQSVAVVAPAEAPQNAPEAKITEKPIDTPQEEIKRWEKKALNDLKEGRDFRKFESETLSEFVLCHLPEDLNKCTDKEEVKECFTKWKKTINEGADYDLERLYKKLDEIVKD
jgi:hypothetical protein